MAETSVSGSRQRIRAKEHWSTKLPSLEILPAYLNRTGRISEEQMIECYNEAKANDESFTKVVIRKGYVSEKTILEFYASNLDIEYIFNFNKKELEERNFSSSFFVRFNYDTLNKMKFLPLYYESVDTSSILQRYQVHVVLNDPWQILDVMNLVSDVIRKINYEKQQSHRETDMRNALNSLTDGTPEEPAEFGFVETQEPQIDVVAYLANEGDILQVLSEVGNISEELYIDSVIDKAEAEAQKFWTDYIGKAIRLRASDMHITPYNDLGGLWIRNRIDGVLEDSLRTAVYSPHDYGVLLNKLVNMAGMNSTKMMIPQSGVMRFRFEKKNYDIRVEVIPTIYAGVNHPGNKIQLRLLYKNNAVNLESMGLYPEDLELVKMMREQPQGMILAAGPTSSGKTTTIYSILQTMDLQHKAVYTAEDPVEYKLENVTQIPVREAAGCDYHTIIRSLMRLDPDIIYLGEIRDEVSSESAVRLANTGHVVLSTIHTNSSYSVAQRLKGFGVEEQMLSTALTGIIAQRLVRRNCPHCLQEYNIDAHTADLLQLDEHKTYWRGSGMLPNGNTCPVCKGKGTLGRIGIFEITPLYLYPEWVKYVETPFELREFMLAKGLYKDLYGDALKKIEDRQVSPEMLKGIIVPVNSEDAKTML